MRRTRLTAERPGLARLRGILRLLAELAPIMLVKVVAAALLWWLMFGARG
jgi:hypothetical protein